MTDGKNTDTEPVFLDPDKYSFISIDLGARYTGLTFWKDGVGSGTCLLTNPSPVEAEGPVVMYGLLRRAIDFGQKVDLIVLEDYGYGGGFFNTDQAEMVGMLKLELPSLTTLGMCAVAPNVVKKCVTGSGRARKGDVLKSIRAMGYTVGSSHEADSIALFLAYREMWKKPSDAMIRRSLLHGRQ